jgi:hypothetical protein
VALDPLWSHLGGLLQVDHDLAERVTGFGCSQCLWCFVELGWSPRYDFQRALGRLQVGEDPRNPLAVAVDAKGYHAVSTGIYTVR